MDKKRSPQSSIREKAWAILTFCLSYWKSLGFKLFIYYLVAILIGSVFLVIPGLSIKKGGQTIWYDDALFISTSAITDTGLTPANISETYNVFGQVLIMLFIQIGGIGLVAFKFMFWWFILGRLKLNVNDENILHLEKGGTKKAKSTTVIRRALFMFAIISIFAFVIFTIYFVSGNNSSVGSELGDNTSPTKDPGKAVFYGLFHTISAMNNAGFDIFGGRSLAAFKHDQFVQIFTLLLFIIGGIGFPIIYDLVYYLKARIFDNRKGRLMLLTKITLVAYFGVMIVGSILAVISEAIFAENVEFVNKNESVKALFNDDEYSWYEKWMVLFFHTSSARSAGFSFYPIENFSPFTRALLGILMFIGAGPSSTGGGIRVTSLFVVLAAVFTYRKNNGQVNLFKKTLHDENRKSAYRTILASSLIVIGIASLIVLIMGDQNIGTVNAQNSLFFETVSAFGTTGLSYKGTTSSLNAPAKLLIALIMIIGQLGVNNVLIILRRKGDTGKKPIKQYPIEHVVGI